MSDRDPLADVLYQSETSSAYRLDEASDYTQCLYRDLAPIAREHIAKEIEAAGDAIYRANSGGTVTEIHAMVYRQAARIARRL